MLEGAELIAVAGRECAAGRPSMDVLLGGMSELITLYPKGCLSPLKPRLLLPEVAEAKNWRGGFLTTIESVHYKPPSLRRSADYSSTQIR